MGKYLTFDTRTFCGSAKATVTVDSKTYQINGGICAEDSRTGYAVNVGTIVIGGSNLPADAPLYFGLVIETNGNTTATGTVGGKSWTVLTGQGANKINVAADKSSGTVDGSDLLGAKVTASYTC
jgi:hypothetical protein